jgi:hypothetical protein
MSVVRRAHGQALWCPDEHNTCEGEWHVSRGFNKHCDCGETRNPAHRTWWQRIKDRRARKKIRKQAPTIPTKPRRY